MEASSVGLFNLSSKIVVQELLGNSSFGLLATYYSDC
jgi:hypothetical protein